MMFLAGLVGIIAIIAGAIYLHALIQGEAKIVAHVRAVVLLN